VKSKWFFKAEWNKTKGKFDVAFTDLLRGNPQSISDLHEIHAEVTADEFKASIEAIRNQPIEKSFVIKFGDTQITLDNLNNTLEPDGIKRMVDYFDTMYARYQSEIVGIPVTEGLQRIKNIIKRK